MSRESCLVLPPYSSEGFQVMNETNGGRSSAGVRALPQKQNHLSAALASSPLKSGSSSMSSAPRHVSTDSDTSTDCSARSFYERVHGRRLSPGSSSASAEAADDASSSAPGGSDQQSGGNSTSLPQDQQVDEHDEDFEAVLISQRNKRVILNRLYDIAPRGRLSQINLTRRGVDVEDARLLKQVVIANTQLSVLKLGFNGLGDEGAEIIASAISHDGRHHENLAVLDLGFNSIGDAGCEALATKGLAGNYKLHTLYLSGNRIGEAGALSIAGAILRGTALSRLHLFANMIGPMGIKAIAGAVTENDTRIADAGDETVSAVPTRIEELHLGSTSITSDGFVAIPGMLLLNGSLRFLSVSNNGVDDNDMMLLSKALSQNKNVPLETLHLSFNEITCQGVECLMNAVWGSPTLRELKLDNNRIKDRGAQLCAVVLTSIPLEVLDLSMNRVTTIGIKALMKNLSENDSMRSLGLSGIPIDQNASKAISYALAYNCSLQALYMDNCSAGYAAQRHIVAGIVSNRRSSLRLLTGFQVAPIAKTLGMPRIPEEWANDRVFAFFRLMWRQWLLKSGRGTINPDDEATKGPAPPAAVAAAAKISLAALGGVSQDNFQGEGTERPIADGPPVDPLDAILEHTDSGEHVPMFNESPDAHIHDWIDEAGRGTGKTPSLVKPVRGPLDNPVRRNRNLQWLRLHFRSLNDIGRLPFNNAHLWQLHQFYFSPPYSTEDGETPASGSPKADDCDSAPSEVLAPPSTPVLMPKSPSLGRAVSFQALGDAFAASDIVSLEAHSGNHKRRSDEDREEKDGPVTKRAKNLKPRIAYYPRVMAQIQSSGTRPMDNTLSLLRQLKYTESIMFAGKNPYIDFSNPGVDDPTHSDVEMILLDLL